MLFTNKGTSLETKYATSDPPPFRKFLDLISLPTTEIEGRRPADFPPTFRNQAGDPQTPKFYRTISYTLHTHTGFEAGPANER